MFTEIKRLPRLAGSLQPPAFEHSTQISALSCSAQPSWRSPQPDTADAALSLKPKHQKYNVKQALFWSNVCAKNPIFQKEKNESNILILICAC